MVEFKRLDETKAFQKLATLPVPRVGEMLTAQRIAACDVPLGGGLTYNWAAAPVDASILAALGELAEEQALIEKYRLLAEGEVMNTGEGRMVLHHLARGRLGKAVLREDRDLRAFYEGEREKAAEFARAVHSGKIVGSAGEPFSTVVQIGIGGSDLGPRALYLALERWALAEGKAMMGACFISNVDPDDGDDLLASLDLSTSLFVLVSKSGVTQETLANECLVRDRLEAAGLESAKHMVAVTSESSPLAGNEGYIESFYIDDYIGGRYSSSSAVGGVILSLAFGPETFAEFLSGAHETDKMAQEKDISEKRVPTRRDDRPLRAQRARDGANRHPPLLRSPLALPRSPPAARHGIQRQTRRSLRASPRLLDGACRIRRAGHERPALFLPAPPPRHRSRAAPVHRLPRRPDRGDIEVEGSTSRQKLNANLAAQIVAFARGKTDEDKNKEFPGGRPSSLIRGARLDPRALGALLAHYENKVMFQGFAWNINSFDQEGVQLGKQLAKKVLAMATDGAAAESDPALAAYARMLGLATAE